jgi:hypothetical protein
MRRVAYFSCDIRYIQILSGRHAPNSFPMFVGAFAKSTRYQNFVRYPLLRLGRLPIAAKRHEKVQNAGTGAHLIAYTADTFLCAIEKRKKNRVSLGARLLAYLNQHEV